MVLDDLLPGEPKRTSLPPTLDDHFPQPYPLSPPAVSYAVGHPPPTMQQLDPPPVTRLIPENLIASLPVRLTQADASVSTNDAAKCAPTRQPPANLPGGSRSLFCAERDLGEIGMTEVFDPFKTEGDKQSGKVASKIIPLSSSCQNENPTSTLCNNASEQSSSLNINNNSCSDVVISSASLSKTSSTTSHRIHVPQTSRPIHVPLTIKIPNVKVKVPTKKGGKKDFSIVNDNRSGLLAIAQPIGTGADPLATAMAVIGAPVNAGSYPATAGSRESVRYPTTLTSVAAPIPASVTVVTTVARSSGMIVTGAGVSAEPQIPSKVNYPSHVTTNMTKYTVKAENGVHIISTCDPSSKVPTPPSSHLNGTLFSNFDMTNGKPGLTIPTNDLGAQGAYPTAITAQPGAQLGAPHPGTTHPGAPPPIQTDGGGKVKRQRARTNKQRTQFTQPQIVAMEQRFEHQRYLTTVERREFAAIIGLDDKHIKVWFQNRRSKLKRKGIENGEVTSSTGCPSNRLRQGNRKYPPPTATASNRAHPYGVQTMIKVPYPQVKTEYMPPTNQYFDYRDGIQSGNAVVVPGGALHPDLAIQTQGSTNTQRNGTLPVAGGSVSSSYPLPMNTYLSTSATSTTGAYATGPCAVNSVNPSYMFPALGTYSRNQVVISSTGTIAASSSMPSTCVAATATASYPSTVTTSYLSSSATAYPSAVAMSQNSSAAAAYPPAMMSSMVPSYSAPYNALFSKPHVASYPGPSGNHTSAANAGYISGANIGYLYGHQQNMSQAASASVALDGSGHGASRSSTPLSFTLSPTIGGMGAASHVDNSLWNNPQALPFTMPLLTNAQV